MMDERFEMLMNDFRLVTQDVANALAIRSYDQIELEMRLNLLCKLGIDVKECHRNIGFIDHDLKHSLSHYQVLLDSLVHESRNRTQTSLIDSHFAIIQGIKKNLMLSIKYRGLKGRLEFVNLADSISKINDALASILLNNKITIEFADQRANSLPSIAVNKVDFEILYLNLIKNAINGLQKSSYHKRRILIGLKTDKEEGYITLQITDNGCGVDTEIIPKLFFEPMRSEYRVGLGLMLAKSIVDRHKGRIKMESELGKGTRVTIKLPYNQGTSIED